MGSCKIGRGGASLDKGSVTPGIVGMSGGREIWGRAPATLITAAKERIVVAMMPISHEEDQFEIA